MVKNFIDNYWCNRYDRDSYLCSCSCEVTNSHRSRSSVFCLKPLHRSKKSILQRLISGVWTRLKCQIMSTFGKVLCCNSRWHNHARHRRPRISQRHTRETWLWTRCKIVYLISKRWPRSYGSRFSSRALLLDNNLMSIDNLEISSTWRRCELVFVTLIGIDKKYY